MSEFDYLGDMLKTHRGNLEPIWAALWDYRDRLITEGHAGNDRQWRLILACWDKLERAAHIADAIEQAGLTMQKGAGNE